MTRISRTAIGDQAGTGTGLSLTLQALAVLPEPSRGCSSEPGAPPQTVGLRLPGGDAWVGTRPQASGVAAWGQTSLGSHCQAEAPRRSALPPEQEGEGGHRKDRWVWPGRAQALLPPPAAELILGGGTCPCLSAWEAACGGRKRSCLGRGAVVLRAGAPGTQKRGGGAPLGHVARVWHPSSPRAGGGREP